MAAAFANSPEAIAVLAVIQALMDSKVEVHRGGEFWALVSAKVRTEHGFNIGCKSSKFSAPCESFDADIGGDL